MKIRSEAVLPHSPRVECLERSGAHEEYAREWPGRRPRRSLRKRAERCRRRRAEMHALTPVKHAIRPLHGEPVGPTATTFIDTTASFAMPRAIHAGPQDTSLPSRR